MQGIVLFWFQCRNCDFKQLADSNCIYVNKIMHEIEWVIMMDFNIYINILLNVTIFTRIRNTCKGEKYIILYTNMLITKWYLFNIFLTSPKLKINL